MCGIDTREQEVLLQGDSGTVKRLRYDVLVMATGFVATSGFPTKTWDTSKQDAVKMFLDYNKTIQASERIAIVGGGAVGVEIAAELATDYPEKEVLLFHPNQDLIQSGLRQKTQTNLRNILQRMKVKIKLGK